jgi:hypothetical protein
MTDTLLQNQYNQTVRERILKSAELNWAYLFMNVLAARIGDFLAEKYIPMELGWLLTFQGKSFHTFPALARPNA